MNTTSIWEEEKNFLTKFPHNFRFFNWVLRGRFKKENSLVPKVTQSGEVWSWHGRYKLSHLDICRREMILRNFLLSRFLPGWLLNGVVAWWAATILRTRASTAKGRHRMDTEAFFGVDGHSRPISQEMPNWKAGLCRQGLFLVLSAVQGSGRADPMSVPSWCLLLYVASL